MEREQKELYLYIYIYGDGNMRRVAREGNMLVCVSLYVNMSGVAICC